MLAVTDPRGPNRTEHALPACAEGTCTPGSAGAPCWCLQPDPLRCPTSPLSLAIEVNRAGITPVPGEVVELFCRAE